MSCEHCNMYLKLLLTTARGKQRSVVYVHSSVSVDCCAYVHLLSLYTETEAPPSNILPRPRITSVKLSLAGRKTVLSKDYDVQCHL